MGAPRSSQNITARILNEVWQVLGVSGKFGTIGLPANLEVISVLWSHLIKYKKLLNTENSHFQECESSKN
jgi:hypothetical protein